MNVILQTLVMFNTNFSDIPNFLTACMNVFNRFMRISERFKKQTVLKRSEILMKHLWYIHAWIDCMNLVSNTRLLVREGKYPVKFDSEFL